jgi:hypothetical protein
VTRTTLKEIDQFTPKDRPSIIVTTDSYIDQWFMNWRIGRFYLPDRDFWVLLKSGDRTSAQRIRRDAVVESLENTPVTLPIKSGSRIIWLIEPQSEFYRKLSSLFKLSGGRYVFYTDTTGDSVSLTWDGDHGIQ